MKLKTNIKNGRIIMPSHVTDSECNRSLEHDAVMAHVLLMAIGEVRGDRFDTTGRIYERAREILAEWGYGDESA